MHRVRADPDIILFTPAEDSYSLETYKPRLVLTPETVGIYDEGEQG
jgi:hypothetical protein